MIDYLIYTGVAVALVFVVSYRLSLPARMSDFDEEQSTPILFALATASYIGLFAYWIVVTS